MNNQLCNTLLAFAFTLLSPVAFAAGDAAKGKEHTAVCSGCHGADGNSPVASFPKLAGLGEKYLITQMKAIKEGKARQVVEMTGMLNALSDQDMADVAAYYSSQSMQISGSKAFTVKTNSSVEVDSLKLGEDTYRAGNAETKTPACTGCHSPKGLGNAPAGFPRIGGQHAQYIEKQLRDYRAGDRATDGADAQIMRKVAEHLSDAEILSLANYIAGLH